MRRWPARRPRWPGPWPRNWGRPGWRWTCGRWPRWRTWGATPPDLDANGAPSDAVLDSFGPGGDLEAIQLLLRHGAKADMMQADLQTPVSALGFGPWLDRVARRPPPGIKCDGSGNGVAGEVPGDPGGPRRESAGGPGRDVRLRRLLAQAVVRSGPAGLQDRRFPGRRVAQLHSHLPRRQIQHLRAPGWWRRCRAGSSWPARCWAARSWPGCRESRSWRWGG